MGIHETTTPYHWNYFLALDDDVKRLARFIEPTKANFPSYSLEMARILLAAASEVDVVAKQLCQRLDDKSKAHNMDQYREKITLAFSDVCEATVHIPKFGLSFKPWEGWKNGQNPIWWKANTNVKHRRHTNFSDANLKNTLNAVGGLFLLLLYFYSVEARQGELSPDPGLFRVGEPFITSRPMYGPPVTLYSRDPRDLVG